MKTKMDALAELRSIERRGRQALDDLSIPFLAHLRDEGVLSDQDWRTLRQKLSDALAFLRDQPRSRKRIIEIDADPRNSDWIRLVGIYKLTGHRLPG